MLEKGEPMATLTAPVADYDVRAGNGHDSRGQRNGLKVSPDDQVCREREFSELLERVLPGVDQWRDHLTIGIGRVTELVGLKDTQIRYFEELHGLERDPALPPGATRYYSLADLRRLAVFAELLRQGQRPAQAAEMVRQHAHRIDRGGFRSIADVLQREGDAITDGFLLSRLASQVIFAAQRELNEQFASARIIAMFVAEKAIDTSSAAAVQAAGESLAEYPQDMLVALDRAAVLGERIPGTGEGLAPDDDSSIVLFYSREPWNVPVPEAAQFCSYRPSDESGLTVVFMVQAAPVDGLPPRLDIRVPARKHLLDWMIGMCHAIFPEFRAVTKAHGYRYRSDGYRLAHTREALTRLMQRVRSLIFGAQAGDSMACLLLPNDLYQPAYLSILAHAGYPEEIARTVRVSLRERGDGLSGKAFLAREPFFTREAATDDRVLAAQEERCQVALAVPLLSHWDTHPFGVLYLASRHSARELSSDMAFVALVFGNILSELLGRWWLTRLRRTHDGLLHAHVAEYIRWFDGMDLHGPDFERGLQQLEAIWERVAAAVGGEESTRTGADHLSRRFITLVVLDIDHTHTRQERGYEPFLLAAQRHVQQAVAQIVPGVCGYWFKNDHTLLILDGYTLDEAVASVRRVASRVQMLPVTIAGCCERTTITISAALQELSYQELYDVSHDDREELRVRVTSIIDAIYERTRESSRAIWIFRDGDWRQV